jgi:hypothetical protein
LIDFSEKDFISGFTQFRSFFIGLLAGTHLFLLRLPFSLEFAAL